MGLDTGWSARTWRRRAGLTQQEVAERAGMLRAAVARIESGGVTPSVATLDRILRACGAALAVEALPGTPSDRAEIRRLLARHDPVDRLREAKRPGFNPLRMLLYLAARSSHGVVIGAAAARLQGAPVLPTALELCIPRGEAEEKRFAKMRGWMARPRANMDPDTLVVRPDPPPPFASFEELRHRADRVAIGDDRSFAVAALDDLIRIATFGEDAELLRAVRDESGG